MKNFNRKIMFPAMAFSLLLSCSMPSWVPFFGEDEEKTSEDVPSSNDNGDVLYTCQLSSGCLKSSISDCSLLGGSVVGTCQGNQVPSSNSNGGGDVLYTCQLSSGCLQLSISNCSQAGGSIVGTCQGNQVPSSSSKGGSNTRCKDTQNRDLYCNWETGCYAIDPAFAETPGQTCATLIDECRVWGSLFAGTSAEGPGIRCGF